MTDADLDGRLRAAMFAHLVRLAAQHPDGVPSVIINDFTFEGRPMPLVVQPGIWKPAILDAALTIRTTYTRPGQPPPYQDAVDGNGFVRYHYQGTDPEQFDNRALRAAMSQNRPLAYFVGVARGVYHPQFPVYVLEEDQSAHEFVLAVDEGQRFVPALEDVLPAERRAYVQRLTRLRLHQPVFRARVLRAYGSTCAMCRLWHAELLDAAHILPDHLGGQPIVPNGLSLCKIHHAAYDQNIVGVRPDLVIKVRRDILDEVDGPMLRHGLQEMDGGRIIVPKARDARPDPGALEERFAGFRAIA